MKEAVILRDISKDIHDHGVYSAVNFVAQMLERTPERGFKLKLAHGLELEVKPSSFQEDLPWDAYIRTPNGGALWADGLSQIEAIHKVIHLARCVGKEI